MIIEEKTIRRFWSRVNIKGVDDCWNWDNPIHKFGYGCFRIDGKTYLSHRIAKIIQGNGKESNLFVLHGCNNPACCNPNHLRWGTQKENIQDSIKAGTKTNPPRNGINPPIMRGESNPKAIMTVEKIIELRKNLSDNSSPRKIAKKYGISVSTFYQIKNYKTWTHV